jgi:hypothetical protein
MAEWAAQCHAAFDEHSPALMAEYVDRYSAAPAGLLEARAANA